MEHLEVLNPVAISQQDSSDGSRRVFPAERPPNLVGKTVGLFWNGKPQGNVALERTKSQLRGRIPNVTFVDYFGDLGGINRYASPELIQQMIDETDAVIATTSD